MTCENAYARKILVHQNIVDSPFQWIDSMQVAYKITIPNVCQVTDCVDCLDVSFENFAQAYQSKLSPHNAI